MKRCLDCNCPINNRSLVTLRCRSCAQKAVQLGRRGADRKTRQVCDMFGEEREMATNIRDGSAMLLAAIKLAHPERVPA